MNSMCNAYYSKYGEQYQPDFKGHWQTFKNSGKQTSSKAASGGNCAGEHLPERVKCEGNGIFRLFKNTIYKLSEAEIKEDGTGDGKNSELSNSNTLSTAKQAGYDWVVHFGDTEGYRYCESYTDSLFSNSCEIDYTLVEEFSAVSMKYKYQGKKYSVQTDTLVDIDNSLFFPSPVPSSLISASLSL